MLQSSSRGWGGLPGPGGLPARGWGVCLVLGGGGFSLPGGCPETPPVNRITHMCKNITLATTSLRPVITHHDPVYQQQLQTKTNCFKQSRSDDSDNLIFSVRFLTFHLFSGHFGNSFLYICKSFL